MYTIAHIYIAVKVKCVWRMCHNCNCTCSDYIFIKVVISVVKRLPANRGIARNFLVRGLRRMITVCTHLVYKACWVWGYVPTGNF